jgi:ABC-2 type transport system ATP-binding protein
MTPAIRTVGLEKDYGNRRGLDGLDLEVHRGEVYGFLGPNGSGKTTTIRILLDVIRPSAGSVEVLGLDPRADGPRLRARIGYLPGDFLVDGRQTPAQLFAHLAALRGGVDPVRLAGLIDRLGLDPGVKIRKLSKGNRQKVGLVQAFMHDPELLVLDEPTGGLDPLLQREFQAMVAEAVADGRTVFMSSHVLGEVQATAHRVGIIRDGRLVAGESVDDLREKAVRRVTIRFDGPVPSADFLAIDGVEDVTVHDGLLTCRLVGRADALVKAAARHTVIGLEAAEPDLEDTFYAYYAEGAADVA